MGQGPIIQLVKGVRDKMGKTVTSQNTKEGTTGIINYCSMHVQYVQLFIVTANITWGKIEIGTRTRTAIIIL